jgi:hypothetical protein
MEEMASRYGCSCEYIEINTILSGSLVTITCPDVVDGGNNLQI